MNKNCKKSGPLRVRLSTEKKTRRERPKSAPYLRLKNIQGTTIGNIWKNYFFQKKIEIFFFEKKYFFRKSHNSEKLKKRPFRLIKRFYKPKTSKKMQLIDSENFRKKSRIVPKKTKKIKRNETKLWSRIYFWKHKKFVV